MTLAQIADEHRLQLKKDSCGDLICPGRDGHLYLAGRELRLCLTDDGRKTPLTPKAKAAAIKKLGKSATVLLNCDAELIAALDLGAVKLAISVLRLKRRRNDAGIPRDFKSEGCIRALVGQISSRKSVVGTQTPPSTKRGQK